MKYGCDALPRVMGCQGYSVLLLWAAPAQTDCRKICTGTLMPCEMVKPCCAPPTSCTSGSAAAALVKLQVVLSVWPSQSVTISVTLYVPACAPARGQHVYGDWQAHGMHAGAWVAGDTGSLAQPFTHLQWHMAHADLHVTMRNLAYNVCL